MVTSELTYQMYRFTFSQIIRANGYDSLLPLQREFEYAASDMDVFVSAVRGVREEWHDVRRVNEGHSKTLHRDNIFVDLLTVQPEVWL